MTKLRFNDGEMFDTSGPLRIEERADGLYGVGPRMLMACETRAEAEDLICNSRVGLAGMAVRSDGAQEHGGEGPHEEDRCQAHDARRRRHHNQGLQGGEKHTVGVTEDGFKYGRKTYRSLPAIAKQITGYAAVSGPRWFGLVEPKGGAK